MGLQNLLQSTLQRRLPKVIDARTHGIIDYAHATFFLGTALVLRRRNPRAALACLTTGALVLGQSLLTDYPLGAEPAISFETHGRLDAGFAAISPWIPRAFGFSDTAAAHIFRTNAFVETALVGLTDFRSVSRGRLGSGDRESATSLGEVVTRPGEIGEGRAAA